MTKHFETGPALLCLLSFFAITACETTADNNIEKARQCLDNVSQLAASNPSAAATIASTSCEPLIQNVQTVEAGLIGVGIVLVEEQKLSNLVSVENAVNQGSNAVATSLSFLVFTSQAHVTNLSTYAATSASGGAQELSSIISLAYYANIAAAGGLNSNSTPAQISGYVTTLAGDPVNGPPAAAALLSAKTSACAGGTSTLCTDLTNAIGGAVTYSAILTNAAAYIASGG